MNVLKSLEFCVMGYRHHHSKTKIFLHFIVLNIEKINKIKVDFTFRLSD